ncbi:Peptidase M16C associated [Musa troglodytarum]|uniref:Peptidase M16C associated n=1 Tax=Musa troglodytarum TaxID=320322 RepID=A0A9E7HM49_9LILI|nr:Peptidase M16C associated [Musa troglodytarum]
MMPWTPKSSCLHQVSCLAAASTSSASIRGGDGDARRESWRRVRSASKYPPSEF